MYDKSTYITNNLDETQEQARLFAQQLQPGDIILLSGELGAGKTSFVQGLAKGLGISHRIISPTFVIVRSYSLRFTFHVSRFYHIDLYRLSGENDLDAAGVVDILQQHDAITAIEWPEKLGTFLPKKRWDIQLKTLGGEKREIEIVHSNRYE